METSLTRRRFMAWIAAGGAAGLVFPAVGRGQSETEVTAEALRRAEGLFGLTFTDDERNLMRNAVAEHLANYRKLREVPLGNDVSPALAFQALLPGRGVPAEAPASAPSMPAVDRISASPRDLPFLSIREQGALLRAGRITSLELTRLYLGRLRRFDPQLACVITLAEERALAAARRADEELRAGVDRGPLHGIPWGAKDLIAAKGYRTTWGAKPFETQVLDVDAAVVEKLDAAGAVLVAKLSVGALAWGDVWFGGTTKNPWKLEQGSSGSSAGSAAATIAGLVGFALGTETLGSIISPAQRCGAVGLRPTFGRVSRFGCMALSWSMDKIGVLARHVEDCALVLDAIRGADGRDECAVDAPFSWRSGRGIGTLRVGFDPDSFNAESPDARFDQAALRALRGMGITLHPVKLPDLPVGDMLLVLEAEAAAAFDDLTRSGRDDMLVRQVEQAWPNVFRAARFIPAVEYIQANRLRRVLMQRMEDALGDVDVYAHSTYGGASLLIANLTGHPAVAVPNGLRDDGTPASISFTGKLFGEAELLAVAEAFAAKTGHTERRPPRFAT